MPGWEAVVAAPLQSPSLREVSALEGTPRGLCREPGLFLERALRCLLCRRPSPAGWGRDGGRGGRCRGRGRHVSGLIITGRLGCPRPRLLTRAAAGPGGAGRAGQGGWVATRAEQELRAPRVCDRVCDQGGPQGLKRGFGERGAYRKLLPPPGRRQDFRTSEPREPPGLQPRTENSFPSGGSSLLPGSPSFLAPPGSPPFLPRQVGADLGKRGSLCWNLPRLLVGRGMQRKLLLGAQTLSSPPTCPFPARSEWQSSPSRLGKLRHGELKGIGLES